MDFTVELNIKTAAEMLLFNTLFYNLKNAIQFYSQLEHSPLPTDQWGGRRERDSPPEVLPPSPAEPDEYFKGMA